MKHLLRKLHENLVQLELVAAILHRAFRVPTALLMRLICQCSLLYPIHNELIFLLPSSQVHVVTPYAYGATQRRPRSRQE